MKKLFMILSLILIGLGTSYFAGAFKQRQPRVQYSLDTPEGQALHRAMQVQIQQLQSAESQSSRIK